MPSWGGGLLIGNLDCEPLSSLVSLSLVLCGLGVRLLPHRALGASASPPAPARLAAPPLCVMTAVRYPQDPGKSGPGLCFLPRNFPGWPWGPAHTAGTAGRRAVHRLLVVADPSRIRISASRPAAPAVRVRVVVSSASATRTAATARGCGPGEPPIPSGRWGF
jgi:hypothetical protein